MQSEVFLCILTVLLVTVKNNVMTPGILTNVAKQSSFQLSYVQCLEMCLGYEAFRCETFSYCYNDMRCRLSTVIFVRPMTSEEVVYQGDCTIVSRE